LLNLQKLEINQIVASFLKLEKWVLASDEHREMHCATAEVCAKEVLTVTECCPLQVEQCFHEVINWGPDVS
jgi:hypothetical protein